MTKIVKNILIVGGTSGLGLALAKKYTELGHHIFITGRKDPGTAIPFYPFTISADTKKLAGDLDRLIEQLPKINTLVYTAGYYQEGTIDELGDQQIQEMINVGLVAPILCVQRFKNNCIKPLKVMLITSSSEYTPRQREPVYTAVKAGLAMFGNSLGMDKEIGKVLVVAPSGMRTPFWKNTGKDASDMLDPEWVAEQIISLSSGVFKYKKARILRNPQKVEIVEQRESV